MQLSFESVRVWCSGMALMHGRWWKRCWPLGRQTFSPSPRRRRWHARASMSPAIRGAKHVKGKLQSAVISHNALHMNSSRYGAAARVIGLALRLQSHPATLGVGARHPGDGAELISEAQAA